MKTFDMKHTNLILLFILFFSLNTYSQKLSRVKHFGKNPGHLKMFVYKPDDLNAGTKIPLIVVLHGCTQTAGSVAMLSGWNKLANENGFIILYPQQRFINNPQRCFCWYRRKNVKKNRGENYSIRQMVDYVKKNYEIDSGRVFITGLSAGAAMGVSLMANYPETFNAGAILAGAPYRIASGYIQAMMALLGWRVKSPEKWGKIVRAVNPDFKGSYPKLIIYQGKKDKIVSKRNGVELLKQWTNINNISMQPTECIPCFTNNPDIEKDIYVDNKNKDAVIYYKIDNLGHALLVDTGKCFNQGGKTGLFAVDKNFHSTYWIAVDFGLLPNPMIDGKNIVEKNEQNLEYTVPLTDKSKYEWSFPGDCKVNLNNGGNTISLNWGESGGNINVIEIDSNSCRKQYSTLSVKLNK
jgi:poly(hydroxyalkanoate) depolymerase family esterase